MPDIGSQILTVRLKIQKSVQELSG